jgi:hypothetical protein
MRGLSVLSLVIAYFVASCAAGNAATSPCGAARTMLDGVCVSEQVADYVACVRAQGAKLGEERSRKLSAEAGIAGTRAAIASDVGEHLERQYATSDANTLEIIRTCGSMRATAGGAEDVCARAAQALVTGCGYENDAAWLGQCRASSKYQACLSSAASDCNKLSACGLAKAGDEACGGVGAPTGSATCEATGMCTNACKGDVSCVCRCFASASPASALGVGRVSQCFNLHCAGCGTPGASGCDACFRERCQQVWDSNCVGK